MDNDGYVQQPNQKKYIHPITIVQRKTNNKKNEKKISFQWPAKKEKETISSTNCINQMKEKKIDAQILCMT